MGKEDKILDPGTRKSKQALTIKEMSGTIDSSHYYFGDIYSEEVSDSYTPKPNRNMHDRIRVVAGNGSGVYPMSRALLSEILKNGNSAVANFKIIDPRHLNIYTFDSAGHMSYKSKLLRGFILPSFTSSVDIFGNKVNFDISESHPEPEESIELKATDLTFDKVYNLIYNPEGYKTSKLISDRLNDIIYYKLFGSEKFDEIFAIEKDRPESPLMRKYISILAKLVDKEIDENSGEINNLEELEKKAYEESGYVGKSLEVVKQEASDYQNYFRFLVTMKEKKVITEEQNTFIDTLIRLLDTVTNIRKSCTARELSVQVPSIPGVTITENIILMGRGKMIYFKKLDHIHEYKDLVDDQYFTSKIVVLDEMLSAAIGKESEIVVHIFDENLNLATVNIKSSTLTKWRTKMLGSFSHMDEIINNSIKKPSSFIHNNILI